MHNQLLGTQVGDYPLPLALCWHSQGEHRARFVRLHLVLVEVGNFKPWSSLHPCFPGGQFKGLLWGYATDNNRAPVWEVRPNPVGQWLASQACHVSRAQHPAYLQRPNTLS